MIKTGKKNGTKFATYEQALTAFSSIQFDYMKRGYLVSSNVCTEVGYIQLTVHFDLNHVPSEPLGAMYTTRECSSFERKDWQPGEPRRIRTVDYTFEILKSTN